MKKYLTHKLDYNTKKVANIYDEITLWSAPFGALLLNNIPMGIQWRILDVGFGTGFPLIELSQRFDSKSEIFGIDLWTEGIKRTKLKIKELEIENIHIEKQNAEKTSFKDGTFDLITSNLGINNFENRDEVIKECRRIIKETGKLCITTNTIGTFEELFDIYRKTLIEVGLIDRIILLENYINHRGTTDKIISDFESFGFENKKLLTELSIFRFPDGRSILNHSLIRIGFIDSWREIVGSNNEKKFFEQLELNLNRRIELSVPVNYFEFNPKN